MFELLASSIDKAAVFFWALGYPGVFWTSFLDRLTVFLIPAEIVLPAFGILVSQAKFSFWPVMIWVTAGNFLGNLALYFIFLKGGRPFLEKYGRYCLISKHDLDHLDRLFLKYGDKLVFWGYFIPSSGRSIVPIPAGISRMNLRKFSLYTFFGSMPLNFLYVYVGIKAGDNLERIFNYVEKFNYVFVGLLAILVIWYIYRHKTRKHLTHD
ncbi:MAG: hypothetical protein A2655_02520 [Candidatus Yanofskybacteria bacterium RIFCSPHIGHO2_01_FULL_43_42]|uniref:VTT domain-containing protein n=1 Tax=Candidatus Yanofskybacteria bacterium RIFCSPLOWO2_01_FULL_43_22 TaxID=1802695 RepID=A0A1F8GFF1_9BACT|nr:MAG: hypothetical protein A2655_02520 [Candidatus Yanofskybacteria bacterium RIFCSPHIGHO2_01_FULL_43_42]OGN13403.1 MAG: hypothetical protein A3D48_00795 [Candidatus Yanofskybacteria bacterium RIFCSPHIGHO2_02_FULL_43_17]OGN23456.1 MAG: hypothetical protein A3A13_03535 [Candidatus Yanofskybacteria bacterium RIFCSPLOWO2_01_FULL_43_22]